MRRKIGSLIVMGLLACATFVRGGPILGGDEDVPWPLADRQTVALVTLRMDRVKVPEIAQTLEAVLGDPEAAQVPAALVGAWMERLRQVGLERVVLGVGAPVDEDGEETDPPTWVALKHRPADPSRMAGLLTEMGQAVGVALQWREEAGAWTCAWAGPRPPQPPLSAARRAELEHALSEARGGAVTGALVLSANMRRDLARMLGEFGELYPDPLKSTLRRMSTAAEHWQHATAGLWLGRQATVRVELSFDDPAGTLEFVRAVEHLKQYIRQVLDEMPPQEKDTRRDAYRAALELCRVRHADRSVIWEVATPRLGLLRPFVQRLIADHP